MRESKAAAREILNVAPRRPVYRGIAESNMGILARDIIDA